MKILLKLIPVYIALIIFISYSCIDYYIDMENIKWSLNISMAILGGAFNFLILKYSTFIYCKHNYLRMSNYSRCTKCGYFIIKKEKDV